MSPKHAPMDDIYLPEEEIDDDQPAFTKKEIHAEPLGVEHPSGVKASEYVKIKFDNFVALVANHSFEDVFERNKDQEIILPTNLLTDLANARNVPQKSKAPLLLVAGAAIGALLTYLLF